MSVLRFVGLTDDRSALLVDDGGVQREVPIDRTLKEAVAACPVQLSMPMESSLSPREIQARIRAGETSAHIAELTGMSLERVARWEDPVLRERAHRAEQARLVGDPTLDDLVSTHLAAVGLAPVAARWDACRRDDATWVVVMRYAVGDRTHEAHWAWDPERAKLTPLDGLGHAICYGGAEDRDELTAVLRPLRAARADEPPTEATAPTGPPVPGEYDTAPLRVRGPMNRVGEGPSGPDRASEPGATRGIDPATEVAVAEPPPVPEAEVAAVADLSGSAPTASTASASPSVATSEPFPPDPEQPPTTVKAGRRKRPQVPTWDEIVFGAVRPAAPDPEVPGS